MEAAESRPTPTERKVRAGFAVAIAFLVAIGVVSYLSAERLRANSLLVTRSHVLMSNIDLLVSTTFESESAQRAYIITGEEPFAADYTRAAGRVGGLLQELRDDVRDDRAQLARLESLAAAVSARLEQSDQIVELRRAGGMQVVQQRLAQNRNRPGAALQARVKTLAQDMKIAEIA